MTAEKKLQLHDSKYREVGEYKVDSAIPADLLRRVGSTLPAVRSIIFAHTESGAVAYQVVRIGF